MSDDEFIDINKIPEIKEPPVYQVQAKENSSLINIIEVGRFKITPNVLIKKFKINPKIHCNIISCLHFEEQLHMYMKEKYIPMIQFVIYLKKKQHKYIYVNINFVSDFDNINRKTSKGKFTISYHVFGRYAILETFDQYLGHEKLIERAAQYIKEHNLWKPLINNL